MDFLEVQSYIETHMYYKEKWVELDQLSEDDQGKVKQAIVNNAIAILYRELPHHFSPRKEIPIDVLAEQCLHILERDDSHRRAEMGVSYFMASGLYLSFDKNFKDWTIAPTILVRYPKRKTGRYAIHTSHTFRGY